MSDAPFSEALMVKARQAVWSKLAPFVAQLLPGTDAVNLAYRAGETGSEEDDTLAHGAIAIAVIEANVVDAFLSGVERLASEAEEEMAANEA